MNIPRVASEDEWLAARKHLLAQEKEASRAKDALDAARRALPMVRSARPTPSPGQAGRRACPTCLTGAAS